MAEQIDPRHLLINIARILKQLKIPYIITGGMAVLIWGRPRFTADIDIVVELKKKDMSMMRYIGNTPKMPKRLDKFSERYKIDNVWW